MSNEDIFGLSLLATFFILAFLVIYHAEKPKKLETICIDNYVYFKASENMNTNYHERKNFPTYNILIKDGKPVRCE